MSHASDTFEDGNGRMGRLWQTLVLSRWRPLFALIPVESVVRDRQQGYYAVLGQAGQAAEATVFVEFISRAAAHFSRCVGCPPRPSSEASIP